MWWTRTHRVVRPVASTTLAVCATVLLLPAIIVNWARANIYDSDAFADHAEAALEDEAVRAMLARELVDRLVEVGPSETLSIRPLLELVTATVVDTQAFVRIYRDSVQQMHREIFSSGDGGTPVALTLIDAMIVITAMVEQAYPEVAAQLPPEPTDQFIELRQRDWTVDAVTFGEDIEVLALVLPLLVVAVYGGALAISPDRRGTLAAVGFGWVTVAALVVVGREYAQGVVLDQRTFENRAVGEAIWHAYTGSLTGWAVIVGGVGLAVAVVATGTRRRVDAKADLTMVARLFSWRPVSSPGRVVRAVAFVLAGVLIAWQSARVLEVLVAVAGAYVVYYGIGELIWLAGPGATQPKPARPRYGQARAVGVVALRSGAVGALALAAIGGGFVSWQAAQTAAGGPSAPPAPGRCNGHAELCDRRLNEVAFLGSHNAMSAVESGWYFPEQLSGIEGQLETGVRALYLDTWYGYDTGKGVRTAGRDLVEGTLPPGEYRDEVIAAARRLESLIGEPGPEAPLGTYLCHAYCELGATPLVQALRDIDAFLAGHPDEVVMLFLQDQIAPEDTAKAFIASGLVKRVYTHEPGVPVPTLGAMIESGERVVVFADKDASGVDWYLQGSTFFQETPFAVDSVAQLSCVAGRGDPRNPLFALNHWIGGPFPSTDIARQINAFEFLLGRAKQCAEQRGAMVNVVALNFVEIGDGLRVVDALNGVSHKGEDGN